MRQHQPWKLLLIFALTLLNGITAGFSIVLLIPLLQLLNIGDAEASGGPALLIRDLAAKAGLPLTLETILLTYVALLSLTALLQYRKALLDAAYQQTFIYRLRQRLFRKIILADWQHLNQKSKTNHLQVLTKEVPNLAYYYYCFLHLLTALIMTLSYTAWAMMVSVQFTVIVLLAGLLLFILLRSFLRRAFHLGEGAISSYNRLLK